MTEAIPVMDATGNALLPAGKKLKDLPTLIIVEDQPTAASMQKGVDPNLIMFGFPFMTTAGYRVGRIFVRWPSPNWFKRRKVDQGRFQDWVRMDLTHRLVRGGDFMYF